MAISQSTKTVVVLGAAYGGAHAAQILAQGLPEGWKVVLIDRNSHANHVYILPRLTVLPSHEHKAFIPYRRVFLLDGPHPHLFLQCHVVSLAPHSVKLSKSFPEHGINDGVLDFDYLVYALGSVLPGPSDLWGSNVCGVVASPEKCKEELIYQGEKTQGIDWLKKNQKVIEDAPSVLVVGGGALGVQFATDIAAVHPNKKVTLLHSRERLLPRFNEEMHAEILASTVKLGVDVILGERLDLKSVEEVPPKRNEAGQRVVRTVKGRELAADLLMLCTGQRANTEIMGKMDPATVDPGTHLVHVLRTLQVGVLKPEGNKNPEGTVENTPYSHIFAVGDAADAFGAIQAGHTAYAQAELAGKNILKLIDGKDHELESYKPGPPGIKVSLGLKHSVYQVQGVVGTKDDGVDDLQAAAIWPFFGIKVEKDEDMDLTRSLSQLSQLLLASRVHHDRRLEHIYALPQETVDFAHRIFDAARNDQSELLLAAVDAGLPVNLTNEKGNTLLMLTAYSGHLELTKQLLERKADPNRLNDNGQSVVAGCVFKGHDDIVRLLVERGADVRLGKPNAIQTAHMFGRQDLMELLGARDGDIDASVPTPIGPPA